MSKQPVEGPRFGDRFIWELARQCANKDDRVEVIGRLSSSSEQQEAVLALFQIALPNTTEGPYERGQLLGAGSLGDVYLARNIHLGRDCALKLVPGSAAVAVQLKAEATRLGALASVHNVVKVYDAGCLDDGTAFIEMELCADPALDAAPGVLRIGSSLQRLVKAAGPLSPVEAAKLMAPICRAVEATHARDLVHGDIKPENILITPISRRPMLADFGLTSVLASARGNGGPVGTVCYMAPELFYGECSAATPASDIYTLGGTLLFTLSGKPPHADRDGSSAGRRSGKNDTEHKSLPISQGIPMRLRRIIDRAMDPNPTIRLSAREMAEWLEAFIDQRALPSEPLRERLALVAARYRWTILAGAAIVSIVFILSASASDSTAKLVASKRKIEENQAKADALEARVRQLQELESLPAENAATKRALDLCYDDRIKVGGELAAERTESKKNLQALWSLVGAKEELSRDLDAKKQDLAEASASLKLHERTTGKLEILGQQLEDTKKEKAEALRIAEQCTDEAKTLRQHHEECRARLSLQPSIEQVRLEVKELRSKLEKRAASPTPESAPPDAAILDPDAATRALTQTHASGGDQ